MEAYNKALEEYRKVSAAYRAKALDYRARRIDDKEFLAAREKLAEESIRLDLAEANYVANSKLTE